jgi:hypothetical protein
MKADNAQEPDLSAIRAFDLALVQSWRDYRGHLEEIAHRIHPAAYEFFHSDVEKLDLHDGYLLSLNFGDCLEESAAKYERLRFGRGPSTIEMRVLNYEKSLLYSFKFKSPRRVVVDIPSSDPIWYEEGKTLGQIYTYELISKSPQLLSVEWLLDSGGTIQIDFEKLIYNGKRVRIPKTAKSQN